MTVVLFVIAVAYFIILNRLFNVYYFGCAGITSVFIGCTISAGITLALLGALWKVIVVILIILAVISLLAPKNE